MFRKGFAWGIGATFIVVLGYWGMSSGAKDSGTQPCSQGAIPAETVADHLHAVIQADRTFYTTHVVERMQAKGVVVASENWQETKDRKSTRLNSSHGYISYAVFCLKKKKTTKNETC